MTPRPTHREGVASWQEHLRQGGKTPWLDFEPSGASVPQRLGSAVHLELVRRLDATLPDFADLADLVLATPIPGRGSVDIPLVGEPDRSPGAPPVDPADLPADELLRLAAGVLAPMVTGVPLHEDDVRRPRPFARRFRVWGAPLARAQLRDALLARGWREAPRGGTTFVIGAPLSDGVAQVWAQRVRRGALVGWPRLWRGLESRDRMPASLDYSQMVEVAHAAGERVVPLVGDLARVAEQLRRDDGIELPGAPDLVAVEVTRRINAVLTTRVPEQERPRLAPALDRIVGRSATPLTGLAIPPARREWALRRADPVAGYAQPEADLPDRVPPERALDLALAAIGRGWTGQRGREA